VLKIDGHARRREGVREQEEVGKGHRRHSVSTRQISMRSSYISREAQTSLTFQR
jgi:hypothetical protein